MGGKYYRSFEHLLKPDPVYGDVHIAKFISCIMHDGKRSTAEKIFYESLELVRERVKEREPIEVFKQAIDNIKPMVEVRSKRVGGANYQVPVEVNNKRQRTLAYRWLLEAARGRRGRPMRVALADELMAAYNKEGGAILKRENAHKQAEANKAFAHFAF
jgi:small subunit ribosomal protein S7